MTSKIQEALDEANAWMNYDGVEGIGQGEKNGKECIVVFVSRASSELAHLIPETLKGLPIVFEESGEIDIQ